MATYPRFPQFLTIRTLDDFYRVISTYTNELTRELDLEDAKQTSAPSTKIYTVTSITEIGRPSPGDVAYSTSSSIFRGYTTTVAGWVDFN